MVADSRETLYTGTCKPLNIPLPVNIEEDANGLPVAIVTGRRHVITGILNRWRIDDEWWRSGPVSRSYFSVMLASGQQMTIYKDLITEKWLRQY